MKRTAIGVMLAVFAVLTLTNAADACHRRRGCHGCYSNCSGVVYSTGCHCSGGAVSYRRGGPVYYSDGARYSYYPSQQVIPQRELVPGPAKTNQVPSTGGTIVFRAPQNAEIWVDGQVVARGSDGWRYTVPQNGNRQRQTVQVKARWKENGRVVNQERSVTVEPSGQMTVNFMEPADGQPRNEQQFDRSRQKNQKSNTPPPNQIR